MLGTKCATVSPARANRCGPDCSSRVMSALISTTWTIADQAQHGADADQQPNASGALALDDRRVIGAVGADRAHRLASVSRRDRKPFSSFAFQASLSKLRWGATVASMLAQAEALNMRLVGQTDLNGHGDCMHVNLKDGFAFVAHMGESRVGTSVVDVSDPRRPRVVAPARDAGRARTRTRCRWSATSCWSTTSAACSSRDATSWQGGLKVFDVSPPAAAARDRVPGDARQGRAPHDVLGAAVRVHERQRRRAHRPVPGDRRPVGSGAAARGRALVVSRARTPGAARRRRGRRPRRTAARRAPSAYALHHPLIRGDRAYCGWWDAGLVILDIAGPIDAAPRQPAGLWRRREYRDAHRAAAARPRRAGRHRRAAGARLQGSCRRGCGSSTSPTSASPQVVGEFPMPEGDFCLRGGRFGPHNVHEMRPGTLSDPNTIYVT